MAVWQVCFNVIEKNKNIIDEDIFYWDKEPVNVYDISFLKKTESWSNDIIQYGDLQETCVELLKENGRVIEISVRLDLRSLTQDQINDIIKYIIALDANILYQNEIIIPSVETIKKMLVKTNAYKYCNNPILFMDSLYNNDNS